MYSIGDEFEFEINEINEYFTCLGEFSYAGGEYLICENEDGVKRVFSYDLSDEELILIDDEEEEENILDHFQEETYKMEEKPFDFWEENDFSNYESFQEEDDNLEEEHISDDEDMEFLDSYSDDESINEFVDDLFDDDFFDEEDN